MFLNVTPQFCQKNWLLVVFTILAPYALGQLQMVLLKGLEPSSSLLSMGAFITFVAVPLFSISINVMLYVRLFQSLFSNKVQATKYWGMEWSKRETSLLKVLLIIGFSTICIFVFPSLVIMMREGTGDVSIMVSVLSFVLMLIMYVLVIYVSIRLSYVTIFATSLDKTPIRSAFACTKGKFWRLLRALLLFTLILGIVAGLVAWVLYSYGGLPLLLGLETMLWVKVVGLFFYMLMICFLYTLFQAVLSEDDKERITAGMRD